VLAGAIAQRTDCERRLILADETRSPVAVSQISPRRPTTPASAARSVLGMPHTPHNEVALPSRALARTGAGCGIAYVALAVVGNDILGSASHAPAANASPAAIGAFVASHPATTSVWIGAYLVLLGLLAFIGFVSYLYSVLRRADRDGGFLPTVVLASGLVATAVKLASAAPGFAILYRARDGLSPQLATALFDMNNAAFALDWALSAVMLAATAGVVLRTGVLPRWLGRSALAIAPLLLASVPLFTTDGPPIFLLALLWIIAASVALIRRLDPPTAAATGHQPPPHPIGTAV
jgi:hypothetical protein